MYSLTALLKNMLRVFMTVRTHLRLRTRDKHRTILVQILLDLVPQKLDSFQASLGPNPKEFRSNKVL